MVRLCRALARSVYAPVNGIPEKQAQMTQPHPARNSILRGLSLWGIWRVALSLWGCALWRIGLILPDAGRGWLYGFRPAVEGVRAWLVDLWLRWDTIHYLRIVSEGYGPDERSVYFPLYPMLGRTVGALFGGDGLLGLLLVGNLAAVGAFTLLDRLARVEGRQVESRLVLRSLVCWPTSFLLLAAYPHAVVLFLCLAAYLALRGEKPWLALVCGLAAGLTHSTALALMALLIVDVWQARMRWPSYLAAFGPVFGVAGFMAWRAYAGFPSMGELISEVWGRTIGVEIDLQGVMTASTWLLRGWPNLLALLLGGGAVVWSLRRQRFDWASFQAAVLLIPILAAPSFEPLAGLARYALIGFPAFFTVSRWTASRWARLTCVTIGIAANLYLCGLFLMWGFVG